MKKFVLGFIALAVACGYAGQDSPADPCNPSPLYYDHVYSFDCVHLKNKKSKENEMIARTAYLLEQVNTLKDQVAYQQQKIEQMDYRMKQCDPDCYGKENW